MKSGMSNKNSEASEKKREKLVQKIGKGVDTDGNVMYNNTRRCDETTK